MNPMPWNVALIAAGVKMLAAVGFIMIAVPMIVWLERKLIADMQARVGPSRVGPFGLLQSFADGLKLLTKESVTPRDSDLLLYMAAPIVVMIPALVVASVVPFAGDLDLFGYRHRMVIADIPMGFLFVLALTSLGVYGVVLSGWSSNSKYSLLGGLRAAAQMVSYELPMGLSVVTGVMIASHLANENIFSLSLAKVVDTQAGWFWNWAAFNPKFLILPGFIAMVTFYVCGLAETNRSPFDLPEAESELVGGYHTEYGGMKWAMFFLGEYAAMLNVASMTTVLFLGGWHGPYPSPFPVGSVPYFLEGLFWFGFKIFAILVLYIWIRGTMPRIRYDQLMGFAWKSLVPVTLLNVLLVATILTIFFPAQAPAALKADASAAAGNAPAGNAPSDPHSLGGLVPPPGNAPAAAPGNAPAVSPGAEMPAGNAPAGNAPAPAGNGPAPAPEAAPAGNTPASAPAGNAPAATAPAAPGGTGTAPAANAPSSPATPGGR